MSMVLSVWGPVGAPGRTTVAINTAAEFVLMGKRVILVDADSFGSSLAARLGILDDISGLAAACRLASLDDLTPEQLTRIVRRVDILRQQLHVLSGISRPQRWPELASERMRMVIEFLREHYDLVIIDIGFSLEQDEEIMSDLFAPRRNAATLTSLALSDLVLGVSGCDQIELSRFLRHQGEFAELYPDKPLHVIVTKLRASVAGLSALKNVRHALHRFAGIEHIDAIPWDPLWHDASMRHSSPLAVIAPKTKTRGAYAALAQKLAGTISQLSARQLVLTVESG